MDLGFIRIATVSEVKEGKPKLVTAGDLPILIVNVGGAFYAVDALCTHYGGDLSEGKLEGNVITCPNHGAKFDVTTGKVVSGPTEALGRPDIEPLFTYPVKVEGTEVYVNPQPLGV